MKRNYIVGAVVGAIIIAGAGFYAGTAYGKGQTPARGSFANGQFTGGGAGFAGRTGGAAGARGGGGFTTGQILSSGNGSITIQSAMGSSSEIVLLGASTQVLKTTSGSASDLTPGTTVVVTGTSNSDGSLTAQSIQIRPAGMNIPGTRAPQTQGQ